MLRARHTQSMNSSINRYQLKSIGWFQLMSLFINARKACWVCVAESQLDYVFCKTLEINEQYMRQDSVTFHWCSSIILNGNRKEINRPLACLWECNQSGVQNYKIFLQKRKFILFCPPDWLHSQTCKVQGVYTAIITAIDVINRKFYVTIDLVSIEISFPIMLFCLFVRLFVCLRRRARGRGLEIIIGISSLICLRPLN